MLILKLCNPILLIELLICNALYKVYNVTVIYSAAMALHWHTLWWRTFQVITLFKPCKLIVQADLVMIIASLNMTLLLLSLQS